MNNQRPAWLTDPCPPWCTTEHEHQLIEADRRHEADIAVVPVILRQPPTRTETTRALATAATGEVDVAVFRDIDAAETWVAIATGAQSIEFTMESAFRVSLALSDLLRCTT